MMLYENEMKLCPGLTAHHFDLGEFPLCVNGKTYYLALSLEYGYASVYVEENMTTDEFSNIQLDFPLPNIVGKCPCNSLYAFC